MADWDPSSVGGVQFDPASVGATPVPPTGGGMGISGGGVAAGNPPGFDAAIGAQTKQQQDMAARSQTYANDMFPLFKAQQQLAVAPTGKGTEDKYDASAILQSRAPEWLHRAAAYVTNLGSGAYLGGIMTPEQTTAYSEANKYLTQGSLGVAGATRSNEGGQTASAASPSVNIPKPAALAVLQGMIGLRRQEHDMTLQWQNSGQPVANLNKFVTQFQTNADPRVYVWDQLTAPQRKQVIEKMTPAQQGEFAAKVNQAKTNGIYNTFGIGP